jgi:hypothetical protein
MMKSFAWCFVCASVFAFSGLLALFGAVTNMAAFHWSAAHGFEPALFPNGYLRSLAGGFGLVLCWVGFSCLRCTWRDYRRMQAWRHSPWRRKVR